MSSRWCTVYVMSYQWSNLLFFIIRMSSILYIISAEIVGFRKLRAMQSCFEIYMFVTYEKKN